MTRVLVFHWHEVEGAERVERLRRAGFDASLHFAHGGEGVRGLRASPPDAFVVDLSRLPSHGRQVAVYLRQQAWARSIAIVFVGGAAEKVAALRAVLPDATYTSWRSIRSAVDAAIARPSPTPIVPSSIGGYSGTPLPKKLGIKPGSTVRLVGAPDGFEKTLGALPEDARLTTRGKTRTERVLLFCRSLAELDRRFPGAVSSLAENGSLWIVWPKKGSPLEGDLTQNHVRAFGLRRNFVDYKICAVDATWSGLCFSRAKACVRR